jgi:hypothetical protein
MYINSEDSEQKRNMREEKKKQKCHVYPTNKTKSKRTKGKGGKQTSVFLCTSRYFCGNMSKVLVSKTEQKCSVIGSRIFDISQ